MTGPTPFRLAEPAVTKDPRDYYETLRSVCPVAHTDAFGGFWMMSRYQDVREANLDPATFSSAKGVTIPPLTMPKLGE